eukprot:GFKZ01002358.1.p1 GENE.GFKZ01002358.1~~GFKZ01002358.1.p1  ORF type:complete len:341 (+),score=37.20 GFKZ01002358.1:102-1025(+)
MPQLHSRAPRIPLLLLLVLIPMLMLINLCQPHRMMIPWGMGPVGMVSRARLLQIAREAHQDLVYLPEPDILIMTMAKGGTTTMWNWLYRGLTGREKFNMTECLTYVQDVRSHCWAKQAIHFMNLTERDQWRVLKGDRTLRVAVQRDPFERLVSSWKSKYACEADVYGTDVHNRDKMVPALLKQAEMGYDAPCLSIEQFADALESARLRAGVDAGWLSSTRKMDVHIRPQDFFWGEIEYDMVLDVRDLGDVRRLKAILDRLPFRRLCEEGLEHRHKSGGGELVIPEKAAAKLFRYAAQSKVGELKYID